MFVSLHKHLPGPSDDVEHSALCSNSILGTRQMLMHEKTCVIPILSNVVCFLKEQHNLIVQLNILGGDLKLKK